MGALHTARDRLGQSREWESNNLPGGLMAWYLVRLPGKERIEKIMFIAFPALSWTAYTQTRKSAWNSDICNSLHLCLQNCKFKLVLGINSWPVPVRCQNFTLEPVKSLGFISLFHTPTCVKQPKQTCTFLVLSWCRLFDVIKVWLQPCRADWPCPCAPASSQKLKTFLVLSSCKKHEHDDQGFCVWVFLIYTQNMTWLHRQTLSAALTLHGAFCLVFL